MHDDLAEFRGGTEHYQLYKKWLYAIQMANQEAAHGMQKIPCNQTKNHEVTAEVGSLMR
jgi:hypothetical protein